MSLCLRGGRVIDPASNTDKTANLYIDGGRILSIGRPPSGFSPAETIDVGGQIVCPGFVELSAHLREPGFEYKATIANECRAAVASGFTSICCTPDTQPVADNASVVEHIKQQARRARAAKVHCIGALTHGLEGNVLAEMYALKESGCIAVTNGDRAIADTSVLRQALGYAASCELTVILRPLEHWLGRGGKMHDGAVSTRLGIPGIPEAEEVIAVNRDLILVEETGVRAHFSRLSSSRTVALIMRARRAGVPVTADVALANLLYTDQDIGAYDNNFHLYPPLRETKHRTRLRAAVRKREIDAICGNHEPHDADAKATPFSLSAPGMSTLDTFLPALLSLVNRNVCHLSTAIAAVSQAPSEILGLDAGTLAPGAPADVCVFDQDLEWLASAANLRSSGKNTPFLNQTLRGRTTMTLVSGRVVYSLGG
ncbi:MAG: dihydroorotase [Gammaproteobacteria bacterium]|jgi:dihydroorotase